MNGQKVIYGSSPSPPSNDHVVFHIKTAKPFALSQDELTVYPNRVTFVFKKIPIIKTVVSEPVKQIVEVEVSESFLFATLKIVSRSRVETEITNLRKKEAQKARKIIMEAVTEGAGIMSE